MEETKYQTRIRVNFTQSTKNKITCEVTFEGIDMDRTEVLTQAGLLLKESLAVAEFREKELHLAEGKNETKE